MYPNQVREKSLRLLYGSKDAYRPRPIISLPKYFLQAAPNLQRLDRGYFDKKILPSLADFGSTSI